MTLSLHHSVAPWGRTLPKPSALLSTSDTEAYAPPNSSFLPHHMVSNHPVDVNLYSSTLRARRSLYPDIPTPHVPESAIYTTGIGTVSRLLDPAEASTTKRHSSVMSTEDTTSRSASPLSNSPVEGSNQVCICQKEPKIPRPRNAFILFRQHHHAAVVAQHPGLPNPDISKIIGEQWRHLPDQEKEEWKGLAENEKARHSQQYPDYRYKPRRNGRPGGQQSISGPSSATSETAGACQKCGGKSMNGPQTPYTPYTPYTPNTPSSAHMPQVNARMPAAQPIVSPPHSARFRPGPPDGYVRPVPPQYDPRYPYGALPHRPDGSGEGPEPKKRRLNGDSTYPSARLMYAEQPYQSSPHERAMSNATMPTQFHRPNMGPPARTGYSIQTQPNRPSHLQQHRRDPSLTLPPLKTPLSQQIPASLSAGPHSQRSGIEAMIMSIPVLNKIKILSQVAPFLAAPGPASPPRETRGAIIAIEGMDPTSVSNMTHTLAEQLEKEGKFAVRTFSGPDPYEMLASSNKASNGEGEHLSSASFLELISQWHKVGKEMQDYITKKPGFGGESDDVDMQDEDSALPPQFTPTLKDSSTIPRPRTPISAVSPKTIMQTADLTLTSPPTNTHALSQQTTCKDSASQAPQQKPRIPASAIAQAQTGAETRSQTASKTQDQPQTHQRSTSSSTPRPATTSTSIHSSAVPRSSSSSSATMIPIAIVPHYQLTTVDASSIAMPITDAYSPHSHWQWLATLWRGCVGPDVTVIIQAGDIAEDNDRESSSSSAGATSAPLPAPSLPPAAHGRFTAPAISAMGQRQSLGGGSGGIAVAGPAQHRQQQQQQQQKQQDVEVRLMDCRAVVVRAPGSHKGRSDWEGAEWWEKAKRRVGFEVEEFLRR